MTSEKKQLVWRIITGVCVTLLASLIIWIVSSLVKENKIYGQMKQTPEKVKVLELKTGNICKKTDSISTLFLIHNSVQIEQVTDINKNIQELKNKIDMLIELELAKK